MHHVPQFATQTIGQWRCEAIGHDDAVDHVGHHGNERTPGESNGNSDRVTDSPQRTIDTHQTWRTTESGDDQPANRGGLSENTSHLSEIECGGRGRRRNRVGGFHGESSLPRGCGTAITPADGVVPATAHPTTTVVAMTDQGPAYTPAQQRVIDVIGRSAGRSDIPDSLATELRAELDEALRPVLDLLPDGKSYENRFFLNKNALTNVHSCEAFFVGGQGEFEWNIANSRGTIVHKAVEVSAHTRGDVFPSDLIEETIARLSNDSSKNISEFLVTLDEFGRAELLAECSSLLTRFFEGFPPIKKQWHPQTESAMTLNLANNRVRVQGKVDLALGRPPDKVIIDLKTGNAFGAHREDLRLYALIDLLAIGHAPRKVASYYIDSAEIHAEDITEGTLRSACRRLAVGLVRAIELKLGNAEPVRRPGNNCRWCTLLDSCDEGQAYIAQRNEEEGW